MKMFKRLAALLLVAAMVLSGCQSGTTTNEEPTNTTPSEAPTISEAPTTSEEPTKPVRDTLTVAMRSEPSNLDPCGNSLLVAFECENMIYDRLVYQSMDGTINPMLATSWEIMDELTIKFHLRDDVTFHNGEKLTAEDVVYTIQRATENPTSSSSFSSFDAEGTHKEDDYTVVIKLKVPYSAVFNTLASARGNIVCKKAMEELGSDIYGREPIGSGKFQFSKWTAGDSLELVRNDNYWGDKPAYTNLKFRFISENATRAIELETGGIDIGFNIDPGDVQRLEENPATKVIIGPGSTVNYFSINSVNFPELSDVRVRQAMAMALNVQAITDTAYKGGAVVADSILPPTAFAYKAVGPWEYNPERAKQLLEEAGFDSNTVIEMVVADDRTAIDASEMARNMWEAVGINVNISIMDRTTVSTRNVNGENMVGYGSGANTTGNADASFVMWERPKAGYHNSAELSELLAKGKATYDDDERRLVFEEFQQKAWDYVSIIPISLTNVCYGLASDIENFECHPASLPDLSLVTFSNP